MDTNFGTWNMRSLNWSGTLRTLERELASHRSDLLGVHEVVSGKGVTRGYVPCLWEGNENQLGAGFVVL